MSHSTFYAPMTRIYDKRVLGMAPLWMWADAAIDIADCFVYLLSDLTDVRAKHLWYLSYSARAVFASLDPDELADAKHELRGMIRAAWLLAGKS